jgi:predicted metal-dependent hydrolase
MAPNSLDYKVAHRNVRYPRLEFSSGTLLLVLPIGQNSHALLQKHKTWIDTKSSFIAQCMADSNKKKLITRSADEFRKLVQNLALKTAQAMNVSVGRIYFRTMKTKWASLSVSRNLTVNMLMKQLPIHLIKYIIFHEIAHLIESRHNAHFWKIIENKYGNYQAKEKAMFAYWFLIHQTIG